jgi:methylated-DNA-[protein]-cysteine S-methyltransferase
LIIKKIKKKEKMSEFTNKVLDKIMEIPPGKIATYKDVAIAIGHPNAYRAVGQVLGKNPHPYVLNGNNEKNRPCHRVISSSFTVSGFKGSDELEGKEEKRGLLIREGILFSILKRHLIYQDKEYRKSIMHKF